jgi:hypothetical protein
VPAKASCPGGLQKDKPVQPDDKKTDAEMHLFFYADFPLYAAVNNEMTNGEIHNNEIICRIINCNPKRLQPHQNEKTLKNKEKQKKYNRIYEFNIGIYSKKPFYISLGKRYYDFALYQKKYCE